MKMEKFIYDLEYEIMLLEKLVEKCCFFNVDYDDGKVFINKFWNINIFLANGDNIDFIFGKLLYEIEFNPYNHAYDDLHGNLKNSCLLLTKIYKELLQRGIKNLE